MPAAKAFASLAGTTYVSGLPGGSPALAPRRATRAAKSRGAFLPPKARTAAAPKPPTAPAHAASSMCCRKLPNAITASAPHALPRRNGSARKALPIDTQRSGVSKAEEKPTLSMPLRAKKSAEERGTDARPSASHSSPEMKTSLCRGMPGALRSRTPCCSGVSVSGILGRSSGALEAAAPLLCPRCDPATPTSRATEGLPRAAGETNPGRSDCESVDRSRDQAAGRATRAMRCKASAAAAGSDARDRRGMAGARLFALETGRPSGAAPLKRKAA
mmetsp:Transcript_96512/g.295225  ORF Transcript_96512/g.295225 Transcript_96512/m.295225 type:complete len:274 (-) Transcript_96512:7-828(-)